MKLELKLKFSRAADARFLYTSALILLPCALLCIVKYGSGSSLELKFLTVLIAMLLGSFIEVPVYTLTTKSPKFTEKELELLKKIFGVVTAEGGGGRKHSSTVTLNLGGFFLPVAFSIYLMRECPVLEVATLTLLITVITFFISETTGGVGVVVPSYAGIFAIPMGFILCRESVAPLIFTSATLGIILGVTFKLLSLKEGEEGSPLLSIGGAGNFPAIFIIGLLTLLVACF